MIRIFISDIPFLIHLIFPTEEGQILEYPAEPRLVLGVHIRCLRMNATN